MEERLEEGTGLARQVLGGDPRRETGQRPLDIARRDPPGSIRCAELGFIEITADLELVFRSSDGLVERQRLIGMQRIVVDEYLDWSLSGQNVRGLL